MTATPTYTPPKVWKLDTKVGGTWGKMKNQNKASTYVVQWIDGKLEMVWPVKHATKPFVYPVDWLKTWGY